MVDDDFFVSSINSRESGLKLKMGYLPIVSLVVETSVRK
jgi:hypothetical protein